MRTRITPAAAAGPFAGLLAGLLVWLVWPLGLAEAGESPEPDHLRARLVAEHTSLEPGTRTRVGVHFDIDPDWYVYWQNPGDSGTRPHVRWHLPDGVEIGPLAWPAPTLLEKDILATFVYWRSLLLSAAITVPADFGGESLKIEVLVEWLVCQEGCTPGEAHLTLTLPVRGEAPKPDEANRALFEQTDALLPTPLPDDAVTFDAADGALELGVRTAAESVGAIAPGAGLRFFPYGWGVIDIAADQPVTRHDDEVVLALKFLPGKRASEVAGVLVVRPGEDSGVPPRAYRIGAALPLEIEHSTDADIEKFRATALAAMTADPEGRVEYDTYSGGEGPTSIFEALLLAFLGGVILNLMPCVLPVLSLKILGFVAQAGDEPKQVRGYSYMFGAGVVTSFWALGGLLLVLKAGGEQLGWGFQMQEPGFVAVMSFLLFAMGLNLFGLFEIGLGLMSAAGKAQSRIEGTGYLPSFANGVLATLIATPCTAPFMGGALAYVFDKPAPDVMAVFTALGMGMAAPYVVLACFPKWLAKVPKPGPWMETFKQIIAFPLFATVIWLVWVFGEQTGIDGAGWLLIGLLIAALGLWFYGRFGHSPGTRTRWIAGRGLALACLVAGIGVALLHASPPPLTEASADTAEAADAAAEDGWIPFSEERVAALRLQGRPVFVDFTADWCLTCKVNEKAFIETDAIDAVVEKYGFAMVKADWTRKDPAVTRALARFGRGSVPFYVLYSPDLSRRPLVLPEAITSGMLENAMERVAGDR